MKRDATAKVRVQGETPDLMNADAPTGPPKRLLTLREAAAYLGLSYWTLRDYVLAGHLPTVDLPPLTPRPDERPRRRLRRVLIDRADLDAFVEGRKRRDAAPERHPG